MRRRTPGVEILSDRLSRVANHDPEEVVRVLEPLVTEARRARLQDVISRRLASVAVVFDSPYDPHNGAAVVRSCEAFGVQTCHVVQRQGVPFAVATSVSRGAEKWVDVVLHGAGQSLLDWADAAGMPLVAAHPDGDLVPEDLAKMGRVTVVLGNERDGIREVIARACRARVRVPMSGFVESLNVSVTAAVLLHAATRGRSGDLDPGARLRLYARGLYLSVPHADDVLGARRELR